MEHSQLHRRLELEVLYQEALCLVQQFKIFLAVALNGLVGDIEEKPKDEHGNDEGDGESYDFVVGGAELVQLQKDEQQSWGEEQ